MDSADRETLKALFEQALALPPDERASFLDEACAADAALRDELTSLLEHAAAAPAFFDSLACAVLPPVPAPDTSANDPHGLFGQTVSHYLIQEKLGGGGMGVVYRATDTKLGRTVALKFLPPSLSADEEAKIRFIHEAKAASSLDHPNIGYIHEIDETDDGRLFIAMAFYAGETLKKKIARGPLPVEEAVDYAVQIAQGLARAHEAGIVHRDVKPANVMVTERGQVKVVDFGIAKVQDVSLTRTGSTVGTVAYMSPEQASGKSVDHRTDVWSLGVVLYEMLTGQRPFRGDYSEAVIYSVLHEEPEPLTSLRPDVPASLAKIVARALEKDPARRYESMAVFGEALARIQGGAPAFSVKPRTILGRRAWLGRKEWLAAFGFLFVAAAALVYLILEARVPSPTTEEPQRTIAVLPFEDLSSDRENDYLGDGIADELRYRLRRVAGIRVAGGSSSAYFKTHPDEIGKIGELLGVSYVLEGRVRRSAQEIVITWELNDAETGLTVEGDRLARAPSDVVAMQGELARAIASALQVTLSGDTEATQRLLGGTDNVEAHNLYLRGQYLYQQRDFDRALALYEEALALDGDFALAHAVKAMLITSQMAGGIVRFQDGYETAEYHARAALSLEPDLAQADAVLGRVYFLAGNYDEALLHVERAVERDPQNALNLLTLSVQRGFWGQVSAAMDLVREVVRLEPLSPNYVQGAILGMMNYGYTEEAGLHLQEALELFPDHPFLLLRRAHWLRNAGRLDEAITAMEALASGSGAQSFLYRWFLCIFYSEAGRYEEARTELTNLESFAQNTYLPPLYLASAYAWVGDQDRAFALLKEARRIQDPTFETFLFLFPQATRQDPRYQAFLDSLLPENPWKRARFDDHGVLLNPDFINEAE